MDSMAEKPSRERTGSLLREELDASILRELSGSSVPADSHNSPTTSAQTSAKREKSRDDSSSEGQTGEFGSFKLARKGTYKEQKRLYKEEKKRLTDEILLCLSESTFLIESGWMKARTTIKTWTKIWCELKPGGLILYRNERVNETGVWIGTILLNPCRIIERPSKKEGFCFKVYHPLDQNIWTNKGPHGESLKGFAIPLPVGHVIFRAANEVRGREWLSSIELVLRHTPEYFTQSGHGALKDGVRRTVSNGVECPNFVRLQSESDSVAVDENPSQGCRPESVQWNDTDSQEEEDDEDNASTTDNGNEAEQFMEAEENHSQETVETPYVLSQKEELGQVQCTADRLLSKMDFRSSVARKRTGRKASGRGAQVRPGMDLSKVVLPTFILDPRSLLDKLSDYYYHADLISKASVCESPFDRMKGVVVWYLSGFYKKPKGVKKPYNPILGETFRCVWEHPEKRSRTFYIAEQVSHHPPVSAFHVSNRQEGFAINGAVLTKSKYKGNSILAILDGNAKLKLLNRGEEYIMTMPHLICKGMLFGKLSMDLGGKVTITCPTTGYSAELNFSVWLTRTINPVEGKIKLGNEVMATLQGSWDGEMFVTDTKTKMEELCWKPIPQARLNRLTVMPDCQRDFESEKLWSRVTSALLVNNQEEATHEKTILEDNQREKAKERLAKKDTWNPRFFTQDECGEWSYKHADFRPWDPLLDLHQYENDFCIQTKTSHQGPALIGAYEGKSIDVNVESGRSVKSAGRHGSKKRRNVPVDSDTSSGGSVTHQEGHKMVTVPSGGVSGIPHSYVPSKTSDLNIWPALQVMQTQQSQILSELQILRSSLQKTVFHPEIVKRLDFLSQKFQIFLVSAILVFVACVLMLMFR